MQGVIFPAKVVPQVTLGKKGIIHSSAIRKSEVRVLSDVIMQSLVDVLDCTANALRGDAALGWSPKNVHARRDAGHSPIDAFIGQWVIPVQGYGHLVISNLAGGPKCRQELS